MFAVLTGGVVGNPELSFYRIMPECCGRVLRPLPNTLARFGRQGYFCRAKLFAVLTGECRVPELSPFRTIPNGVFGRVLRPLPNTPARFGRQGYFYPATLFAVLTGECRRPELSPNKTDTERSIRKGAATLTEHSGRANTPGVLLCISYGRCPLKRLPIWP